MGYMVAILLMYVDKAEAFTIMLNIINSEPYQMKEYFIDMMPGLKKSYYVLLSLMQ